MILIIGGCGYVGNILYATFANADMKVRCVDICRRGNPAGIPVQMVDYGMLPYEDLVRYDTIVLLAGHSSVADATADPNGAFRNNVVKFQRLLELLKDNQRLIYASSSSVYSGFGATAASEDIAAQVNMYDFSKLVDDALATMSGKRCYGLRFGTVNGPSPNIRNDLMLNRMVDTALREKQVVIQNPKVRRPVLGVHDLARAVSAIVNGDSAPGIYNLASFNSTVASLGATVADELNVPLVLGEPTPTYNFEINTTKFQEAYNFQFQETAVGIVRDLIRGRNGGNGP
jgi:nucleoside-diphosphate-sugar epimerase